MRSIALLSTAVTASAVAAVDYDVVVYGSTPAGIAASRRRKSDNRRRGTFIPE
jgi:hypothetical protein